MDYSNLIPAIAHAVGLQPSTLVFTIVIITQGARALSRRIPDNATGWKGVVRDLCAIIGFETASRITEDATVKDIAAASLTTPPIGDKVAAQDGSSPDSRARNGNTRLVPASALMSEVSAARYGDHAVQPVTTGLKEAVSRVLSPDFQAPAERDASGDVVHFQTGSPLAPDVHIPGDALEIQGDGWGLGPTATLKPDQTSETGNTNPAEFEELFAEWRVSPACRSGEQDFRTFLAERGWEFVQGSGWQKKKDS